MVKKLKLNQKIFKGTVKKHSNQSGTGRSFFPSDWVEHEFEAKKGKKVS